MSVYAPTSPCAVDSDATVCHNSWVGTLKPSRRCNGRGRGINRRWFGMTHVEDGIPLGFCQCGCGQRTRIAAQTRRDKGHVKGQPMRYVRGHRSGMQPRPARPGNGLCECGCGGKTSLAPQNHALRGWVKGRPVRFLPGHAAKPKDHPEWRVEDRGYETPCWVWQWSIVASSGYGQGRARPNAPQQQAHRAIYERLVGPIPEGLHIDHLCRVRACVNPEHLEPVTQAENNRRSHAYWRARREAS